MELVEITAICGSDKLVLEGFCTIESLNCLISVLFAEGVNCSDCSDCVLENVCVISPNER